MNNSFDKSVKEALEQFNPPHNEALFTKVQQNLATTPKSKFTLKSILGGTAILAAAAAGIYFGISSETEIQPSQPQAQTAIEQPNKSNQQEVAVLSGGPQTSATTTQQTVAEPQPSVNNTTTSQVITDAEANVSTNNSEVTNTPESTVKATAPSTSNQFTPAAQQKDIVVFPKLKSTYCLNEPLHSTEKSFFKKNQSNEFVPYTNQNAGTFEIYIQYKNEFYSAGIITVVDLPSVESFIAISSAQDNAQEPPYTLITEDNSLGYTVKKVSLNNAPFAYPTSKPLHLKSNQSYNFEFTVTDENQCTATKSIQYVANYNKYNLLAPAAFSPNGDGLNDEWFLPALELRTVSNVSWQIKNIQGVVVFESTSAKERWNGETPMGIAKPGDLFVWQCKLVNEWNEVETYSGTITTR